MGSCLCTEVYVSKNYRLLLISLGTSQYEVISVSTWDKTPFCFDEGNENAGKATLPHYTFLHISLPSMHDFEVKLPNFTFYGGAPDRRGRTFFSLSELGYGSVGV